MNLATITTFMIAIIATTYALFSYSKLRRTQSALDADKKRLNEMEDALKEKEYHLRTIISSEPECVKLHREDGTILDINPAGAALIEACDAEELLGTSVYDFIDPEDQPSYRVLTEHVFSGYSKTLEFRIRSLKGKTLWMETHATPMRDRDGNIIALLGITRDITSRKVAEEAEIQARKRQEELTRLCRVLSAGEMASALGHELNQPLCAIMNYAETIEETTKSPAPDIERLRGYARKMSKETERAGETVRRIREFVRKREPQTEVLDINTLIREVTEFLQPEAKRHSTSIRLKLSGNPCTVAADSIQVQQVLVNLISNGLDALESNRKNNRILSVNTDLTDSRLVKINVEDNGSGFNGADPEKIFDPFYTTKEHGVGIGLSISRSIAESHGGYLKFSPRPGRGMNVVFALPRLKANANAG